MPFRPTAFRFIPLLYSQSSLLALSFYFFPEATLIFRLYIYSSLEVCSSKLASLSSAATFRGPP